MKMDFVDVICLSVLFNKIDENNMVPVKIRDIPTKLRL